MPIGEKLCNARLARKQTTSEVAAATRMKVQTVEAIEHEDFARIPAPIYAKGFIKLYAEHVGLDPAPLIAEYVARFAGASSHPAGADSDQRMLKVLQPTPDTSGDDELEPAGPAADEDLFDHAARAPVGRRAASQSDAKQVAGTVVPGWVRAVAAKVTALFHSAPVLRGKDIVAGWATRIGGLGWRAVAVVAAVLILLAVITAAVSQWRIPDGNAAPSRSVVLHEELRLAIDPPDPYLD